MKKLAYLMVVACLAVPYSRMWAAESVTEEKTESRATQQSEEQKAMARYQNVVAKHGADSVQAKKAWKRVEAEYKEHGDTPPAQETSSATPKS